MIAPTLLASILATALPSVAARAPTPWIAPVPGPIRVIRPFAPPPPGEPWTAGHRGVDLAAGASQVIVSAGPGTVSFAGPVGGRPVVVVVHGPLRTTYEPVEPSVRVGDLVATGSPIGRLAYGAGSTPAPDRAPEGGHCTVPCLHWGLLRGDSYLDPLSLLHPLEVRLLPQTTLGPPPAPPVEPAAAEPPNALAPLLTGEQTSERNAGPAMNPAPPRFESQSPHAPDPTTPGHPTLQPAVLAPGVATAALSLAFVQVRGRRRRLPVSRWPI